MTPIEKPATASQPTSETATDFSGMMAPSLLLNEMANTLGAELLRFAGRRMQAQAEFLACMAQCRSVQQVLDQQMDFMRRCGIDYAEGFGTFAQISQRAAAPLASASQAPGID